MFPRILLRHLAEILTYRVWLCKLACHLHAIYGISFLETVRTENVHPCLDLVSYYGCCNVLVAYRPSMARQCRARVP